MKKVLISLLSIGVVAAVAVFATQAFFSDTETSTGNTFQAGAIDLKVDNTSYYNGVASPDTSWTLKDLTVERFFNFTDLKPGDWGEDTISLHVNSNPAYVCANIQITDNSDNGITEPEAEAGDTGEPGDLAGQLNFIFWKDDGDNVLEQDEDVLTQGPASDVLNGTTYALADSENNLLDEGPGLEANKDYYIGKAWCFGTLGTNPATPGNGDPTQQSGVTCNGAGVGNISQTDRLMGDISFYAVQTRHNEGFVCSSVDWNTPEVLYLDLENKDTNWNVMVDDTYGTIAYSTGASNFYGVVQGYGLQPNSRYQITLNGPGVCTATDDNLAGFGANLFQSGYWNGVGPGLSNSCTGPGEGIYNMNLIGDEYTLATDGFGNFIYPFNLALPTGTYTGVKVLVKKTLNPFVSPWIDPATVHTTNLFETAAISFTVN